MKSAQPSVIGAGKLRTVRNSNGNTKTGKDTKRNVSGHSEKGQRKKLPIQFPTRTVDWSKMIRVQIDVRTWIYVPMGTNVRQAKTEYLARLRAAKSQLTANKSTTVVKKFKPLK